MSRINVIGSSASGKSTFSRQLAQKLAIPYIEMDAIFWQPNWQQPSDEEFFPKLKQALAQTAWVLDGNYNRTVQIKWQQVDTIIWLDYSLARIAYQSITRAIKRSIVGKELWPNTGNVETFKKSFCSKDSVILWSLQNYHHNRRRYLQVKADPQFAHIEFVHLTSPRQARRYLQQQSPITEQ
ncbi:adenylate kinase [Motilimonas sp. KMU-193]|uniref:adenylate kinase n=1 Tax=Motilimonas sp. KMU-193 TaxID=3388668 RepID=UPI00396B373E